MYQGRRKEVLLFGNERILFVKQSLVKMLGIPVERQTLMYEGDILADGKRP